MSTESLTKHMKVESNTSRFAVFFVYSFIARLTDGQDYSRRLAESRLLAAVSAPLPSVFNQSYNLCRFTFHDVAFISVYKHDLTFKSKLLFHLFDLITSMSWKNCS